MSELHDIIVESPIGGHRFADAMHANFDESRGVLTLVRDVHVTAKLVPHDEYVVRSQDPRHTLYAVYIGPDASIPGAVVFHAIPKRTGRAYGR